MSKVIPILNSDSLKRDYYCSLKFRFQKIDLESKSTCTCHAAKPHDVDFDWLEKNPGQIFNTPQLVHERQLMLDNKRDTSCEPNCWSAEDIGAISPRIYQQGDGSLDRSFINLQNDMEILDLTVGGDCNLTCSYCCKEYSSAWRRDLFTAGEYKITNSDERYKLTTKDKILLKISQPELKTSKHYQLLLQEVKLAAPGLKRIDITGGEPLLDNQLINMLSELQMSSDAEINLITGLGVSLSRFKNIVSKLKKIKNLKVLVSGECTGDLYEFNRYGNKWADFLHKVDYLCNNGITVIFSVTLSNLTLFGFGDFYKQFPNKDNIILTFAYTPSMMAPNILDDSSKEYLKNSLQHLPVKFKESIFKSIEKAPTEQQRLNLKEFLIEFTSRRKDLNLNIFPTDFLTWLGLENVV